MKMYSILLASTLMIANHSFAMDESQKLQAGQQTQNTTSKSVSDSIMESSCCTAALTALEYCCCGWIFLVNKCTNRSNNNQQE